MERLSVVALLVIGATACGGTVTNVGSVLGDTSDGGTPGPRDGSAAIDGVSDGGTDALSACPTSQCVDFDGGLLCEGEVGHRACPGGVHAESCTCGGTAPSHWVSCGGCP